MNKKKRTKPGFTIRPNTEINELLNKLSELSGESKNKLVSHLLEVGENHIRDMITAYELLKFKHPEEYTVLTREIMRNVKMKTRKQPDLVDRSMTG